MLGRKGAGWWLGIAGPVVFIISWVVAGALRDDYSHTDHAISRLAELGAANRWIVTAGIAFFGVACLLFGRDAHAVGRFRSVAVALMIAGAASIGVALFPCSEGCPGAGAFTDVAHTITAGIHYVAFTAAPVLTALALRGPRPSRLRNLSLVCAVVAAVALSLHGLTEIGANGLMQRIGLTTNDVWLVSFAVWIHRHGRYGHVYR